MLIYLSKQRKFATNLPVFPFIFMFFGNADMAVASPRRGHAFIADWERSIAKSRQKSATPGGGGTSHMKGVGMFVDSLRGVNFGFCSHLGCSGKTPSYLAVKVSFRVVREKI